jgi:hypothetical protein
LEVKSVSHNLLIICYLRGDACLPFHAGITPYLIIYQLFKLNDISNGDRRRLAKFNLSLYVYETSADHIVLLAADRRIGYAEMGEVRQISALRGLAAGDLYAGESGAAGGG